MWKHDIRNTNKIKLMFILMLDWVNEGNGIVTNKWILKSSLHLNVNKNVVLTK